MIPSWIRSSREIPWPWYFFAIETTRRRLELIIRSFASLSPRSIRLASSTSSGAVSSLYRPASLRKSCSASELAAYGRIDPDQEESHGPTKHPVARGGSGRDRSRHHRRNRLELHLDGKPIASESAEVRRRGARATRAHPARRADQVEVRGRLHASGRRGTVSRLR